MNQLQPLKPRRQTGGMTSKEFLAFYRSRPDGERWELIEGVAVPVPVETLVHNLIRGNLLMVLENHFRDNGVDLHAYGGASIRIPSRDDFLPRTDLMVAPAPRGREVCSDRFRLVAEVISPSNRKRDIAIKLARYKEHPLCEHVLIIDSRRVRLESHDRAASWEPRVFTEPESSVTLDAFGLSFRLGDLYDGKPLLAGTDQSSR